MGAARGLLTAFCAGVSALSLCGWDVVILHPPGARSSTATGVRSGRQTGAVQFARLETAGVWSGSASSFQDMMPAGAVFSGCRGMDDASFAGSYTRPGWVYPRASVWVGASRRFVNLQPLGASHSVANATAQGQQVGNVDSKAALWHGSAASHVNLAPDYTWSDACATNGINQVGFVWSYGEEAAMWSGTSASLVVLHPPSATQSVAYDLDGDRQGGFARFGGVQQAGLWSGSAGSFQSLHPAGSIASQINAMSGPVQVGWSVPNNSLREVHLRRAAIWFGTQLNYLDLHIFLPLGFEYSQAEDVDVDANGHIWVVGSATRAGSQGSEAILWHYTP